MAVKPGHVLAWWALMERQIIGYRPDGRPIEGPPASAGRARVPLGTLGTPEPPTPPDGVQKLLSGLGWLRSLWEKSGEGLEGLAELAAGVAKDKLDRDIQIIQSVADATKRGVKWSGEFLSGLKEDVQGLTPVTALSATDAFWSMFSGDEREVPAQNNRLDQAAAALGVIGSIMDPSPAGELKAARKVVDAGVDAAAKALRARGAEVAAAANAKLAASLGKAPAPRFSHLERAPVDINDEGRMFVSTRVPTSKKGQVKADAPLNTGLDEVLQDPDLVRTFAAKIRGSQAQPDGSPGIPYNLLTDAQLRGSDEQVVRSFMDTGANNIRYMIDQMEKGGWAQFSREWYDGANVVTGNLARAYRVDPNASTGVVAVLSPQKDWHQNAEMAKRVIKNQQDFGRTNPTFDRDVFDHYRVTSTDALTDSLKEQLREKRITPVTAEWIMQAHPFYLDKYKKSVVGARWQDLVPDDQAIYLRAYDELVNGQRYPVLAPNGSVAHELAITGSGEAAKMSWQSYGAIKKALSILNDPTVENISRNLGNEHKVRAFFDNMSRPEWGRIPGQRGPSTVDTHQVAASHLMPYGASSPVVKYTMGGASNNTIGLSGMNPLYQEMLTEAVKGNPNDYLPRAGQSVSWDGIKSLFSPEQKRDKTFVAKITGLWTEYQQGRMSLKGVQDAVTNEAGGIKPPEWAKRK